MNPTLTPEMLESLERIADNTEAAFRAGARDNTLENRSAALEWRSEWREAMTVSTVRALLAAARETATLKEENEALRTALDGLVSDRHGHSPGCGCPWCFARAALKRATP